MHMWSYSYPALQWRKYCIQVYVLYYIIFKQGSKAFANSKRVGKWHYWLVLGIVLDPMESVLCRPSAAAAAP
jgi:hypothetical protein